MAYEATELEIIHQFDMRDGGRKVIRLVRWMLDGKDKGVKLEKRSFFTDKVTGQVREGKAEGFTVRDLELLYPNIRTIMANMRDLAALNT